MITDIFIFTLWILEVVIHNMLKLIPLHIPPRVGISVAYFGGFVRYAAGIVDIPGVFGAFGFLLDFMVAWFTFKAIMWIFHLIASRSTPEGQAMPTQKK
jgi:hypothetical protein